MDDMLSLADLREIVLPPVPSPWPPAPGLVVWLALALVLAVSAWRAYRYRRRRNAYRRAGLALLAGSASVYEVSVALKRVALAAWPRERVAALHGAGWSRFLNDSCPRCGFAADVWSRPEQVADTVLRAQAARWIRRHRAAAVAD